MDEDVPHSWLSVQDLYSRKVSYAENAEDILLDRVLAKGHGFYVDIGANDPVFRSVTKHFYDMGWRGINVEPNRALHGRLRALRPRDINVNAGVSNACGNLTLYEVPALHGWSSFEPAAAETFRRKGISVVERTTNVTTLSALIEEHAAATEIDFLKIDVEGYEARVVEGMDWSHWRPRVLVIAAGRHDTFEPMLLAVGYHFAAFDGLNRYYVRGEDASALLPAFAAPVNVTDHWVPYEFLRLYENQAIALDLSDQTVRLLQKLQGLSKRHPRLASMVRRALRLAS